MTGPCSVSVKNNKNSYTFTLQRKITILTGDSGRGKTTLYEMIYDYNRYGKSSGVRLSCDHEVFAVGGDGWKEKIENCRDSVIVIDEDGQFIRTHEFAAAVKESSNYFLLITRNYLPQLPYSVNEIYEIKGAGKNKKFIPKYIAADYMYEHPDKKRFPYKPEMIVTEDSGTGFQFFEHIASVNGIECRSSNGKSNIYKSLDDTDKKKVLVIADGAGSGSSFCTGHDDDIICGRCTESFCGCE